MKLHERRCKEQPCGLLHQYYCPVCSELYYVNSATQYDDGKTLLPNVHYPADSLRCYLIYCNGAFGPVPEDPQITNLPVDDPTRLAFELLQNKMSTLEAV